MATSTDDNLIRLMLQPPKTGNDDPLLQASKLVQCKLSRKPPRVTTAVTLDLDCYGKCKAAGGGHGECMQKCTQFCSSEIPAQLTISFE